MGVVARKLLFWPTRYWAGYVDRELLVVVLCRKVAEAVAEMLMATQGGLNRDQSGKSDRR